jgi:hypothetical protein
MANNIRDEKNAGQAVRDTSRRIADETHQFAQTATEMGEGAMRAGSDLFQRNAEMMQQIWEAGRKATSQLTDPSLNPFLRAFAATDQQAQKAAQESARNMEAVLGSTAVVAQELQNISREWLEFAQSRMQHTLSSLDALGRCRTPQDAAAVHTDLLRDNFENLLQSARRAAEISARMADAASRKMVENLNRDRRAA